MGWFSKKTEVQEPEVPTNRCNTDGCTGIASEHGYCPECGGYLTYEETLEALNVDESMMRKLVSHGEIAAFRDGGKLRFRKWEVQGINTEGLKEYEMYRKPPDLGELALLEDGISLSPEDVREQASPELDDRPQLSEQLLNAVSGKPMPIMKVQFSQDEMAEAIRFYLMAKLPGYLSDAAMRADIRILDSDGEDRDFENYDIECIEAQLKV